MKRGAARSGWRSFFGGFCMGTADLIPGISGGTVAFLLGLYAPLLESLDGLRGVMLRRIPGAGGRSLGGRVEWKFLCTLLAGMMAAWVALAHLLHLLLQQEEARTCLYALFFGLIFASSLFCLRQIRRWSGVLFMEWFLGAVAAFSMTGVVSPRGWSEEPYAVPIRIHSAGVPVRNYDEERGWLTGLSAPMLGGLHAQGRVRDDTPVYGVHGQFLGSVEELATPKTLSFFDAWMALCGALAVCALLLPGISGSYVLTLLGAYPVVMEAFVDFVQGLKQASFHAEAFFLLCSLGLGIAAGALGFAGALGWLWHRYPAHLLALLSGFIMGAIPSVWPFWSYAYALHPLKLEEGVRLIAVQPLLPAWDSPLFWKSAVCGFGGFALVLFLTHLTHRERDFD